MPYVIEVISIGKDSRSRIAEPMKALNGIQREFEFQEPPVRFQKEFLLAEYQDDEQSSSNIWKWLREYRTKAKGDRRYTIAIVDAPLRSDRMSNLFGSVEAEEGLAVFTLIDSLRYTRSEHAYVAYYLTRYALGFAVPQHKSHDDTRSCLFDRKLYKPDLTLSLKGGRLCDACHEVVSAAFNEEMTRAIDLMARHIRDREEQVDVVADATVQNKGGALPSADAAERIKYLSQWPEYNGLSSAYHGPYGIVALILALLTVVPTVAPVKLGFLDLHVHLVTLVYFPYHALNLWLFLEVRQAASPGAALTHTQDSFKRRFGIYKRYVKRLGYAVYVCIGVTVILKVLQHVAHVELPGRLKTIATLLGVPVDS